MKGTVLAVFAFGLVLFGESQAMAAGALAIDSKGDQYGFSSGYSNSSEADQRALSECGNGCQVVLQFDGGCGAYAADQASGSTAYGWGIDSSRSAAENAALSECQSHGGSSCMILVWACE